MQDAFLERGDVVAGKVQYFDEDENSDDDAVSVSGVPASMRDQKEDNDDDDDEDFEANDDVAEDSDSNLGFAERIQKKIQADKTKASKVPQEKKK